jgi:GT2 family glycosyltransferase
VEVVLIKTLNKNLATSRNTGLPHCFGDIIAMTDDDAEVSQDWITKMKVIHAEHPEAGGVGGAVIGTKGEENLISRLADQVTFSSPHEPRYVRTLPGVNVSYKREVIDNVGFQDETLFRGEDVDFNWRIKQLGYEIYYDPSIKVLHHHRPTLGKFLLQHYMYGRAYYLVRKKWPEMYCVYPHGLRSFRDMLKAIYFVLSMFFQPIQYSLKMSHWRDKLIAMPILFILQIVWKGGMVMQMRQEAAT